MRASHVAVDALWVADHGGSIVSRLSCLLNLECSRCATTLDVDRWHGLCPRCSGVLLARYRLDEAARTLTPRALAERPKSLWRYAELLPASDERLSLGEGLTPLHHARRLGQALGLSRLYVKDEALNPTGSFKARGMAVAVTMAARFGAKRLALPSAGNAGGAAAAYGALAGIPVELFLPCDTPEPFRREAAAYGAEVHLVDGDISDCGRRMRESPGHGSWVDLSTLREPWRLEGKKTMGFELAEQLGWELPEVIVYPTGGGTGLIGMWKAFSELEELGLLASARRPRMIAVQASGCAPIVRAFDTGAEEATPWNEPRTFASGLRVPSAIGDRLILGALRESRGLALAVSDEEMARGQLELARSEGIFAAPEGGASVAALRVLVEQRAIAPDAQVVLFNTGSGLKYATL
jgi:threonine synthase